MISSNTPTAAAALQPLPILPRVTTPTRTLNSALWRLLTKPEPLTAGEWALLEEYERRG